MSMRFDFDGALNAGASKREIIDYLRGDNRTNLDWSKIDETINNLPETTRETQLFDWLYHSKFDTYKPQSLSSDEDLQSVLDSHSTQNVSLNPPAPRHTEQSEVSTKDISGIRPQYDENPRDLTAQNPQPQTPQPQYIAQYHDSGSDFSVNFGNNAAKQAAALSETKEQAEARKLRDYARNLNKAKASADDTQNIALSLVSGVVGDISDVDRMRGAEIDKNTQYKIDIGARFEDLSPAEQQRLRQKASLFTMLNLQKSDNIDGIDPAKRQFQIEAGAIEAEKYARFSDLPEHLKNAIYDEQGFWSSSLGWAMQKFADKSDEEKFAEWKEARKVQRLVPEVMIALHKLKNVHPNEDIFKIYTDWKNGKVKDDVYYDFVDSVDKILEAFGLEGAFVDADDKGGEKLYTRKADWKAGEYIALEDTLLKSLTAGILDNKFSIAGGVGGFAYGSRFGGAPLAKFGAGMVGGAIGSMGGGAIDMIITNNILGREQKLNEIFRHAAQEGVFSVAGDITFAILGKTIKGAVKIAKPKNIVRLAKGAKNFTLNYAPLVSFANRALDGNAKAADRLLEQTMSVEQQAALKEFGESFGGGMQFSAESKSAVGRLIKEKFGEESAASQAFEKLTHAMSLPTMRERQAAYIQAIRADETGNLIGFLTETLAQSPKASANFRQILNATTHELEKNLEHLNLNKADIKGVFDDLEQATKQSYDEAMNKVLGEIYDDSYKVVISRKGQKPKVAGQYDDDLNAFMAEVEGRTPEIIEQGTKGYDDFRLELEKSGISPQDSHAFLNFVERTIYNPNGVTFSQLLNAQKVLNSFYKETKDPNLKSHIKNAIEGFLRDDIRKGIDDIFKQNPTAYKDAVTLYETALTDYANMSRIKKMVDKKKIRNAETTQTQAVEALIKLAQGQGDKISNFEAITRALTPENRKVLEMNILEMMFQRSLYDKNSLRVLDSGEFFKNLQSLPKDMFQSQEAKDFIALASGFDKLYKNDVLIARAMKPATTARVGSSIATSIEGAAKFQIVRMAFDQIIRLMPHIPYAKGFNQKISGAALRYQLKTALERSSSVSEFKQQLKGIVARTPHNNETKEIIQKITQAVDEAQDTIMKTAERENAQAAAAKGDLQIYRTLKAYDVDNLDLLDSARYNQFVESVLNGDEIALRNAPNIVHIANINDELAQKLGLDSQKVFLRKNDLHHFRPERKAEYNQDLTREIINDLPRVISEAKEAYIDSSKRNFFITKELNENEVATININKDELGNYVVTTRRVNKADLNKAEYSQVGNGVEPSISRPLAAAHLPTDSISHEASKGNIAQNMPNFAEIQSNYEKKFIEIYQDAQNTQEIHTKALQPYEVFNQAISQLEREANFTLSEEQKRGLWKMANVLNENLKKF